MDVTGTDRQWRKRPSRPTKRLTPPYSPDRTMQQDTEPHVEAWENFIALTKWSTVGVVVILALLALFLL